jgi:hypothetical protein
MKSAAIDAYFSKFPSPVRARLSQKGNLQFPHVAPLPLALIGRIARFKAKQDLARAPVRKKKI